MVETLDATRDGRVTLQDFSSLGDHSSAPASAVEQVGNSCSIAVLGGLVLASLPSESVRASPR
jgi:hypothetical protein